MEILERIRLLARLKPRRSHQLETQPEDVVLDKNGYVVFSHNDPENPKNWSSARKCMVTSVAILLVVNATLASSAPSAVLPSIAKGFQISEEEAGLTVTMFLITYAGGPLLWAPLSEHFGRRWIFFGTFFGYLVFNFLCAFTTNFAGLLVGRFFTGVCASSTIANTPGLIVDVWEPLERGIAMALFSMTVFCGPAIGPIIAGFLQSTEDWR